jgi:predicted dehydrogenase
MVKKVRWGVIGAGGIANRQTLPVISKTKNCSLSVVMDITGAEELGRTYGADATESVDEVLARDDVDAVYVVTPVHLHAEQVIAAAKAGKHVLCEKPLARTASEARPMVDACRDAGVLLREAYMLRCHEAHRAIVRLLQEGAIGKPVCASVWWGFLYPRIEGAWRQDPALGGGGSLMDVGCHVFDLLDMFLGPVARVACRANTLVQDYAVDDNATTLLEFESGVQASVITSFCLSGSTMPTRLDLFGSGGAIHTVGTMGQEPGGEAAIYRESGDAGGTRPVEYTPVNTYARQLDEFAASVARGEAVQAGSEAEILRTMAVVDAAHESAKTGRFVEV